MSAEDNFLVSALTSTHPAAGAEARRGAGRGGEGCGASGRRVGVPRALTSSAIFQTFDPFRKARRSPAATAVPPRPPRGSAPAQASEGRGGPPAATVVNFPLRPTCTGRSMGLGVVLSPPHLPQVYQDRVRSVLHEVAVRERQHNRQLLW